MLCHIWVALSVWVKWTRSPMRLRQCWMQRRDSSLQRVWNGRRLQESWVCIHDCWHSGVRRRNFLWFNSKFIERKGLPTHRRDLPLWWNHMKNGTFIGNLSLLLHKKDYLRRREQSKLQSLQVDWWRVCWVPCSVRQNRYSIRLLGRVSGVRVGIRRLHFCGSRWSRELSDVRRRP